MLLIFSLLAAGKLMAEEVMVFAAASLSDAMSELGKDYGKATGETVRFNFAGSNTLARQIEAGAPADVFVSADRLQMDRLEEKHCVDPQTRKDVLGNTLVVITPPEGPVLKSIHDLGGSSVRRLALGHPDAVPAGVYAKAYLKKIGCWAEVESKVVPAENVRAALAFVESGHAQAGIVYKTDAASTDGVKVAWEIPAEEGPPIVYPAAVVSGTRRAPAAKRFLAWLRQEAATEVFEKYGFRVLGR